MSKFKTVNVAIKMVKDRRTPCIYFLNFCFKCGGRYGSVGGVRKSEEKCGEVCWVWVEVRGDVGEVWGCVKMWGRCSEVLECRGSEGKCGRDVWV